jgi:hypothetical protein
MVDPVADVDKTAAKSLTAQQNTIAVGCDNCKRRSECLQHILHLFMIHVVGGHIARQVAYNDRVPRAVLPKVAYLSSGVLPKMQLAAEQKQQKSSKI